MATYLYTALNANGEQTTGSVQAATETEAIQQIKGQNLFPTQIVEQGKGSLATGKTKGGAKGKARARRSTGGRVKPKVLMIFTRQLATLIEAGLPLLRSLTVLAKQEPNPVLRGTINSLADSVQGGSTFSESLAQHPRLFNKLL